MTKKLCFSVFFYTCLVLYGRRSLEGKYLATLLILCLLFVFQNWILFTVALSQKQVDRHLRKLDQELAKFKMELEADNAGITEILERRKYT